MIRDMRGHIIALITSGRITAMGIGITTAMGGGIERDIAIGMDGAIEANLGCAEVS